MEKTLVIIIGNARGGEKAWNSMYENLLLPYDADLAICFGYKENKTESLYAKSKYIWELPEYDEWADYYVENFGEDGIWKTCFSMGKDTGFSGLYGTMGSSAITFAFRHWILKNKRDILLDYDRIIITRSDYFYDRKHPILDNNYFWIPTGEGWGGITDRHHIFPSSDVDLLLGIVDNYVNTNDIIEDFKDRPHELNIERTYVSYFTRIGYWEKVKEFERVQFTVKTSEDPTRWWVGPDGGTKLVPGHEDLYIKYGDEYALCKNPNQFYGTPNVDQNGNNLNKKQTTISLICACKNRNEALKVSLRSWLNYKEISEYIIVDWSSDESLEFLTSWDERIKIIRVENQKYFNQPQPLNLALSQATGEYILKVDCDYVMNPYYSFFEKYKVDYNSFVSGKPSLVSPEYWDENLGTYAIDKVKMSMEELSDYFNTYSPYYKFLTGLMYVSRENLIKINGYNENFGEYYSFEDDEIYKRLELLGLKHKKLDFDHYFFHIPHPDSKRVENFKASTTNSGLRQELYDNLSSVYSGNELEWQTDYVLTLNHNQINAEKVGQITNFYDESKTDWFIQEQNERYYLARIDNIDKLNNFPPVHFISVEHSEDRREKLYEKFKKFKVDNITPHIFKKYSDDDHVIISNYLEENGDYRLSQGSRGPVTSHLKAIKEWLNTTNDEYAFFCEDDLSLETVQYWNFTWEEFMDVLPSKWDCIQLCLLREIFSDFKIEFRSRCWCDWSACAYLITREYAQKLIDTYYYDDNFYLDSKCHDSHHREDWALVPVVETIIFGLTNRVYVMPLFVEDISFKSSYKIENENDDLNDHHYDSYNTIINWWKEMSFKLTANKIITNKIKLIDFPSVNYISLEESYERRESLISQFGYCGIESTRGLISKRFKECDDKVYGEQLHVLDDGTIGCVVSHIKMIKKWYEETDEEYAFFCEDDLSLETVQYWNFTWNDFVKSLPEDAECVQLCCIRTNCEDIKLRERSMYDWSVTAYILTRDYARKIIERYCDGDSYRLEIPGTNFYPMPENVLFYGLGKVYAINLFVEDQSLSSTFYGHTELQSANKEYHLETYEYVLDWWKNNSKLKIENLIEQTDSNIIISSDVVNEVVKTRDKSELENLLTEYSLDPENPQTSYNLALWYEKEGHTAPALSYFLRSAERFENEDLIYEALIKCHHCYDRQGTRDGTAISLLQQALCVRPTRPEAYFLLARFHERRHQWSDCYKYSSLGLSICDFSLPETTSNVEYPGKYGLLFEKAVSGWYWGKVEESKSILLDLANNPEVSIDYYNTVVDNLKHFGINIEKKN